MVHSPSGEQAGHVNIFLSLCLATLLCLPSQAAQYRPKREAGFYTTRFGRSDPMMRFRETQTSFYPETVPMEYAPHHKVDGFKIVTPQITDGDGVGRDDLPPSLICDFSPRKKSYTCHPNTQPSPWSISENKMNLSYKYS